MRSISTKLILAFLSIGIISVTVIFVTARWNTREEFIRFLTDQDRTNIISQLTEYYEVNGTWAGAEHRATGRTLGGFAHRGRQLADFVAVTLDRLAGGSPTGRL